MPKPRIGVTCSPRRGTAYYAPYLRAVETAGGEPVTLDPVPNGLAPETATALVHTIDGLLVPGGWDVDPPAYGEPREEEKPEVDPPLDLTEIALVRAAVDDGVPVFGICRGQQVINVALGGSLRQHIDGHDMHGHPRDLLAHAIDIVPGSELASAVSHDTVMVNSLHHQSVKDVAPALHVTAHSPDGVVEGLESADGLIVAVQCHPEELLGQEGWAMDLFRRFVERVAEHERDGHAVTSDAARDAS
ncbi:MAG TPA: gamma-glutamyl-gamma-aminobutyrate hydrolase family protein [Candidatus Acidoferrales bacterium]|nr:gamma-glutamyl-gamma-aminobutyrate hydrolase family protein [Candidatus Acidoferrales bacterium]